MWGKDSGQLLIFRQFIPEINIQGTLILTGIQ